MTLVSDQMIKIKWNNKHKNFYVSKGYRYTKDGDEFLVRAQDLAENSKELVLVECALCGRNDKKITYAAFFRNVLKNGSYQCKVHLQDFYDKKFKEKGFELLTVYQDAKQKLDIKCENNHCFQLSWNAFKSGNAGCKECHRKQLAEKQRLPFEVVELAFKNRGYELLSKTYKSTSDSMEVICPLGHYDKVHFSSFYYSGTGCKKCKAIMTGERSRHSYGYVKEAFEKRGFKLIADKYENCYQRLECICPRGHFTGTKWVHFVQGHGCFECSVEDRTGEKSVNWKPERDRNERILKRVYAEYRKFILRVKEVYEDKCVCCNKGNEKKNQTVVHHLDGYNWCVEKRTDVKNGVVLCEKCHIEFHSKYGYGNNTKEQFEEWLRENSKLSYKKWIINLDKVKKLSA